MVLVNGSNFIDGLNGLLLKYYLIIIWLYYLVSAKRHKKLTYTSLILILSIILLFNLFGLIYMGDSERIYYPYFLGFYGLTFHLTTRY